MKKTKRTLPVAPPGRAHQRGVSPVVFLLVPEGTGEGRHGAPLATSCFAWSSPLPPRASTTSSPSPLSRPLSPFSSSSPCFLPPLAAIAGLPELTSSASPATPRFPVALHTSASTSCFSPSTPPRSRAPAASPSSPFLPPVTGSAAVDSACSEPPLHRRCQKWSRRELLLLLLCSPPPFLPSSANPHHGRLRPPPEVVVGLAPATSWPVAWSERMLRFLG